MLSNVAPGLGKASLWHAAHALNANDAMCKHAGIIKESPVQDVSAINSQAHWLHDLERVTKCTACTAGLAADALPQLQRPPAHLVRGEDLHREAVGLHERDVTPHQLGQPREAMPELQKGQTERETRGGVGLGCVGWHKVGQGRHASGGGTPGWHSHDRHAPAVLQMHGCAPAAPLCIASRLKSTCTTTHAPPHTRHAQAPSPRHAVPQPPSPHCNASAPNPTCAWMVFSRRKS